MLSSINLILIIGLSIATFQDLRRREVENWITYPLIAIIYIIFGLNSTELDNIPFLISFLSFFLGVSLFYIFDILGGADYKLLIAIFPVLYSPNPATILYNISIFSSFLLTFGILSISFTKKYLENKIIPLVPAIFISFLLFIKFFSN